MVATKNVLLNTHFEDAGQEISKKRSEFVAERDGQVDKQHEVAVANVSWIIRILR